MACAIATLGAARPYLRDHNGNDEQQQQAPRAKPIGAAPVRIEVAIQKESRSGPPCSRSALNANKREPFMVRRVKNFRG